MDRAFIDANVLFSAAYDPTARIASIFRLSQVQCVTSAYVAAEAMRNLDTKRPSQLPELIRLLRQINLIPDAFDSPLPVGIDLPVDDRPALQAAIFCGATHLLTGDIDFVHTMAEWLKAC